MTLRSFLPILAGSALIFAADEKPAKPLFPDPELEAAVRAHVFGKRDNKEPLTVDDVKTLSGISARGKAIKSLDGLENCAALAQLELTGGEFSDLTPISKLVNIQSLTLSNNKIKDISPLAGLNHLQYLELSGNQVSNLSPLAEITTMNSLYLANNQIKDVGPLAKMNKLWSLYLEGNQVSDLKPLGGLKWLSSLDLRKNKVKDLSPLSTLTSLNFLMLEGNPISDLTPLIAMAQKDAEGEKRFAPFLTVTVGHSAKSAQVTALKKFVHTVTVNK